MWENYVELKSKQRFIYIYISYMFRLDRVIHKSLWDSRTRLRNNQDRQTDRHGRKQHINRQNLSKFFFVLGAVAYLQVSPLGGAVVTKHGVDRE
jgi:hypothetical protein